MTRREYSDSTRPSLTKDGGDVVFHFRVIPDMDRAPHRWDSCCREALAHEWEFLSLWLPRPEYWGLLNHLGPQMLGRISQTLLTGKCSMHGKRSFTDAEMEQWMLEEPR